MFELTFEFSIEKLVHAIAYFCYAQVPDLTKLKVAKLLYFADKEHLINHGAPILGDVYWCMDFGPVPSFALNEMNEALAGHQEGSEQGSDRGLFHQVLKVNRGILGLTKYPRFEARVPYDRTVFSPSELRVLHNVSREHGSKTARQLVTLTHTEPTWTIPNLEREPTGRVPIPYELFFAGAPVKSQRVLAKLKADQCGEVIPLAGDAEYADFVRSLRGFQFASETDDEDRKSSSPYAGRA